MITVDEFLKINRIDSLNASKVLAIHSPRPHAKADLLRGVIYCSECSKTLTSMLIPKRDKETGNIIHARYYYKCETVGCKMFDKSARAGLVIDAAKCFFKEYLFVTKSNYAVFVAEAKKEAKRKQEEFDSEIAKYKVLIARKEKLYDQTKVLILESPDMKKHYDLDKDVKAIESLKADYTRAMKRRDRIKGAIPTFEEYLKLLETTPVILDKIQDMKVMDALLRIFFSNFTITATGKDFRQGSEVVFEPKEPWKGFVVSGDFVRGAA